MLYRMATLEIIARGSRFVYGKELLVKREKMDEKYLLCCFVRSISGL